MEAQRQSAWLKVFPSLTDFAFLAPILLLFARLDGAKTLLGDGDTGWHIRAGEWILANGRVPTADFFSFTMPGAPWFAWEWLSEIVFALVHSKFGLAGVVYLGILLISVTSVMLYRLCRRHTNNDFYAIVVTLAAVGATSVHWLARPHLFSFLLTVVSLHLLDRAVERPHLLWVFPPMVALWANLHGAFLIGVILLATAGAGKLLENALATGGTPLAGWRASRMYFVIALLSIVATVANPYGWNLHSHIYRYLTEHYHFDNIAEFQTLSFHAPVAIYFESMLVTGLLAAGWCLSNRRITEALLVLSWLHVALVMGRNIPIYAMVAAPVVTSLLTEATAAIGRSNLAAWFRNAIHALETMAIDFTQTDRFPRLHWLSASAMLVVFVLLLGAPADATKLRAQFDPKTYPEAVLPMLAGKRVFTNDEWGDYLIYKLYPNQKVFVDGRSDFYGPDFSNKYLNILHVRWDWSAVLDRHHVDAILVPADSPLATAVKMSRDWRVVYDDHISILFFATGAAQTASPSGATSLNSLSEVNKPDPIVGSVLEAAAMPNPRQ